MGLRRSIALGLVATSPQPTLGTTIAASVAYRHPWGTLWAAVRSLSRAPDRDFVHDREATMKHPCTRFVWIWVLLAVGCVQPAGPSPPHRPIAEDEPAVVPADQSSGARAAEVSYDTPGDGRFAEFVRRTAGDLVRKIAVGIEHKGVMRVELSEQIAPE